MPHSQTHAPLHSAYELVVLGKQTPALVLERNVDKLFKCAIFSKPRNQSNFICNRIGEAFLPCFGWLKGETGTADNRIICIESRLMLNKNN